ncbi:MAG: high frequency lysogenization protein HflD [Gammaproteobacteria bacterium]|nr:high frequency lysogenization protein HflD [Gammaproteobacteria bacterium]
MSREHARFRDSVLALSGVCQAAALVQQIAHQGTADAAATETSLNSILELNPASTEAVYGKVAALRIGLQALYDQISVSHSHRDREIARYCSNLLALERRLARNPGMLDAIGARIAQAQKQCEHFPVSHENVLANLAGIYKDTISTLPLRIQVTGNPRNLEVKDNQNRVRALLLAGIRSAVLWRQCGGKRRQLLLQRGRIEDATRQLLALARAG